MGLSLRLLGVLAPTALLLQGCGSAINMLPETEKPPPTKVRDLGPLVTEHLPVTRRTRAWFTKATRQLLEVDGWRSPGYIGFFDGTSTRVFELPVWNAPAGNITPTANGAFFTIADSGRDLLWFVDRDGWFRQYTGTPIAVHSIRPSGNRILVLGSSPASTRPHTTGVYELDPAGASYRPLATVSSTHTADAPLLAVSPVGFAFDYATSTTRRLFRMDDTTSHDLNLGAALEYLGAVGDLYYSLHKGQGALHVTNMEQTRPICDNGLPIECGTAVESDTGLFVIARGQSSDRVIGITSAGIVPYDFGVTGNLRVQALVAADAVWALADDDTGRHVWRRNGQRFERLCAAAADARLLAEYDAGYVLTEGERSLVQQLPCDSPVQGMLPSSSGAIQHLFVFGTTVCVLAETRPGDAGRTLYRW